METWVLILTLGTTPNQAPPVANISGFDSQSECAAAGQQWKHQTGMSGRATFTCVKESDEQ